MVCCVRLDVSANREKEVRDTICTAIASDFGKDDVAVEVRVEAPVDIAHSTHGDYIYVSVAPSHEGEYMRILTSSDADEMDDGVLSTYDGHLMGVYVSVLKPVILSHLGVEEDSNKF